MALYYVLKEHAPVPELDANVWSTWMANTDRHVGMAYLSNKVKVSTVFLGINHAYGDGPPILFETMVFGGKYDQFQKRYATWDEAVEGHNKTIFMLGVEPKESNQSFDELPKRRIQFED